MLEYREPGGAYRGVLEAVLFAAIIAGITRSHIQKQSRYEGGAEAWRPPIPLVED